MNLILIGRNVTKLKEIASDIRAEYNDVEIEVIEADFADNDDIKKTIEDGLAGKDIGVLVNNVGVILPHPMYFHEVNLKLVSQELIHFRVIAHLFRQIGGHNSRFHYKND